MPIWNADIHNVTIVTVQQKLIGDVDTCTTYLIPFFSTISGKNSRLKCDLKQKNKSDWQTNGYTNEIDIGHWSYYGNCGYFM